MSWFRRSPFGSPQQAAQHMVELLGTEGSLAGTPLSESEKSILASEERIPDPLREKAEALIKKLLEREETLGETDPFEHPTSFGNSLEWAGDTFYPNVAALTEQIVRSRSPFGPKLRGWKLVKDRVLLIGCALLVIVAMMLGSALLFGK